MADLNDRVDDLEDRLNGVLSVAQNALHEISNLSVIVIGNREEQLLCRADDRIASRLKTSVQIELFAMDDILRLELSWRGTPMRRITRRSLVRGLLVGIGITSLGAVTQSRSDKSDQESTVEVSGVANTSVK